MRPWSVLASATLGLMACGENPLANFTAVGPNDALSEITVTSDRVVLRGPTGFCVDPKSSNHNPAKAFIVFGNCAAIAGDDELPQPFVTAIATATVHPADKKGPSISQSSVALADFFETDAGKASLSASNTPDSVDILDSFSRNGAFFVHARDTSAPTTPGADNTYWRGYFDVKNSVVALSVIGLKGAPVSSTEGLQTLYDFANALLEDQPVTKTPATATTS
ncbi:hypothetical protein SAMN04488001_1851 [Litoreibacter albidus]|uniref:Uncharacterized protein n=2 Tax=Litoreibacter albidus TaxID=670155 RepID=A0A1H2WI64_9RHOB|nr:hypothetical protein SAMN04488001_1851 [Litoreibacter albidus]